MKNKVFYFAILPGLLIQFIGAYLYFILFKDESFAQAIYFATKASIVIWPLVWITASRKYFAKMFGGNTSKSLIFGVISGLAILALVALTYFLLSDFLAQYAANFRAKAEDLNFLKHYILFSLFLSVIHSFIEEYYWRWFILNGLKLKMKVLSAAVVSSLGFASHHFLILTEFFPLYLSVIGTAAIFAAGLLWCGIYLKSGNILGSWFSHFCADMAIMTVGYFLIF